MKVNIVNRIEDPVKKTVEIRVFDLDKDHLGEGCEMKEYTNLKSGLPDPMIFYSSGKWVHFSTILHQRHLVQDAATGEIVQIPNLSPW